MEESAIVITENGDAVVHSHPDAHAFVGHIGRHNVCGGEMHAIPIHTHSAIMCYKCGLRTPALLGVKTMGRLRDNFRCYNGEKEK